MNRFCDGITRRDFVRAGAIGSAFTLAGYLRAAHAADTQGANRAKATHAIFVWLGGGPSHIDTFDPKPDAPAEIRGEFKAIDANASGVRICEHLPKLAKLADSYAIVRGVSHTLAGHELGTEYLNAGSRPIPSLVYPGYGAVVSREVAGDKELPHFVAIPSTPQKAGYLGVRYAPLQTNDVPKPTRTATTSRAYKTGCSRNSTPDSPHCFPRSLSAVCSTRRPCSWWVNSAARRRSTRSPGGTTGRGR